MFVFLQEGANINKSLTTLGKVISALAELVRSLYDNSILLVVDVFNCSNKNCSYFSFNT